MHRALFKTRAEETTKDRLETNKKFKYKSSHLLGLPQAQDVSLGLPYRSHRRSLDVVIVASAIRRGRGQRGRVRRRATRRDTGAASSTSGGGEAEAHLHHEEGHSGVVGGGGGGGGGDHV